MNPSTDIICCILNALDLKIDFEKKENNTKVTNTQLDLKKYILLNLVMKV